VSDDQQVMIEIGGSSYRLLATGAFTLDEWCRIKDAMPDRPNPAQFEQALRDLDPYAWREVLLLSLRRAGGGSIPAELMQQVGDLPLLEAIVAAQKSAAEQETEEVEVGPPARSGGAPASGTAGETSDAASSTSESDAPGNGGAPGGSAIPPVKATLPMDAGKVG
jgi:hypothetical protein